MDRKTVVYLIGRHYPRGCAGLAQSLGVSRGAVSNVIYGRRRSALIEGRILEILSEHSSFDVFPFLEEIEKA